MPEIHFYHLTSTPLERALPKLLEKALQGGFKCVVQVGSDEQAEHLNNALWTYDPNSFLPHGSAKDGSGEDQPIYLTTAMENPNQANLLVVADGSEISQPDGYARILDIFDGTDAEATTKARSRWKAYKERGFTLEYRQQSESGAWKTA